MRSAAATHASADGWSRASIQWSIALENTTSTSTSSEKDVASPTQKGSSGWRSRASATISGEASMPEASSPRAASSAVSAPLPHPRSRRFSPGRTSMRSITPAP